MEEFAPEWIPSILHKVVRIYIPRRRHHRHLLLHRFIDLILQVSRDGLDANLMLYWPTINHYLKLGSAMPLHTVLRRIETTQHVPRHFPTIKLLRNKLILARRDHVIQCIVGRHW